MSKHFITVTALALSGILGLAGESFAQGSPAQQWPEGPRHEQERSQFENGEHVYGWELMTDEELEEHRQVMRSMRTRKERELYRTQHHAEMQERARRYGVDLVGPFGPQGRRGERGKFGPGAAGVKE